MLPLLISAFSILFLLSFGLERISPETVENPVVEATPIELDPETPARKRFGDLTFLSGFELNSADSRFGGLSGLALSADGKTLYAVSDRGYWLAARISHNSTGRLVGLGAWKITPLLTPEGFSVSGRFHDAEALTKDTDGYFIVAFEGEHRLWRYPPAPLSFNSPPRYFPTPGDLAKAPPNGGLESVAALPDGRLLAITEQYKNPDGSLKGWLIEKDQFTSLTYAPSVGFRPSDLATLSSGDVLVLESYHSLIPGWEARIVRLSRASLKEGAQLKGKEIAHLDSSLVVDNFEGMAIFEDPDIGTLLYLVSDDNYSLLQRTLLLQFRLDRGGEQ